MPKHKLVYAFLIVLAVGLLAGSAAVLLFKKAPAKRVGDGKPVPLTSRTFDSAIASDVHLVDFWADWCGPCHIQAPIIDKLAERYAGSLGVGKLDVDSHGDIARRFAIASIPTLVIFKNGKEARRFVGVQPEDILAAAIEAELK